MTKPAFAIEPAHVAPIKQHIRNKFAVLSWWPKEAPQEAKREFDQLPDAAESLSRWCEKWLNGSQWRELKKVIKPVG